ncbi:hypothetical protein ACQEU8_35865 [Streptomyces sp. CA-250714]
MGEEVKMEVDDNNTLWLWTASDESESGGEQQGQESQSEKNS